MRIYHMIRTIIMQRIFLIICAAAVFGACTTESTEESTLASEYLPLRMGNTWYYSYPKNGTSDITTIFTIDSTMELEGKTFYLMAITYTSDPQQIKTYRRFRTEGDLLWEAIRMDGKYQVVKRADFTLKLDETYIMPMDYTDYTADFIVTVLQKTSTMIRFYYDVPGMFDEAWFIGFEKGKGIVYYSQDYQYGLELVRAELKP